MKIFIVYAHPEPKSFNGAMLEMAVHALENKGHVVKTSDLYQMNFNPVSGKANFTELIEPSYFKQQFEELNATHNALFARDIAAEHEKLLWCDLLILQSPMWWFGLPAILKGWVDRVFAMGIVYGHGRMYKTGMLSGKRAFLSLTTGADDRAFQPDGLQGELAGILRPIQRGMLEFAGFDVLSPHVVYGPARLSDDDRANELLRWQDRLQNIENETAINVGRYR